MKKFIFKILVATKLLVLSGMVLAETAVIVHPSNAAEVTKKQVASIFLGKTRAFPNGTKATPVSQAGASKDTFNKEVLGKSASQLKSYWSKLIFTGKGKPPRELENDAEVIKQVSANAEMIGFIDASAVDSTVKVVLTF